MSIFWILIMIIKFFKKLIFIIFEISFIYIFLVFFSLLTFIIGDFLLRAIWFFYNKKRKKNKGKIVLVTNIDNNVSSEYISLSEAALSLNTTRTTLRKYIKNKTVFKILKRDPSGNGVISEQFLITVKEE